MGVLRRWGVRGYGKACAASWLLKASIESASATWAGSVFHMGIVRVAKELRYASVEALRCCSFFLWELLVLWLAGCRSRSSGGMLTWLCIILNISMSLAASLRSARGSRLRFSSISVTLVVGRQSLSIHRAARLRMHSRVSMSFLEMRIPCGHAVLEQGPGQGDEGRLFKAFGAPLEVPLQEAKTGICFLGS